MITWASDILARPAHRRLFTATAVLVLAALLLWPALINGGLPLLFPDSLDYLTNGRDLLLGVTRPPGYAYAILPLWRAAGGLPMGLWVIVVAQALLLAWLIHLTFSLTLGRPRDGTAAGWTLTAAPLLAGASTLPFLATWIMADALTAPTLLSASLLSLAWDVLRRGERVGLSLLLLAGAASHQTHVAIALAAGLLGLLLHLLTRAPGPARLRGALLVLLLSLSAVGTVVALNRVVHGQADTAQASPAFLLARLVGDDLVAPHAAAFCAERPAMPFCRRPGWLGPGRSLDALLWQGDSPIWLDYGGIERVRNDASWIAWRVLPLEWRPALSRGLGRAARLLTTPADPDLDLRPMAEPMLREVASQTPELLAPILASAQLSGAIVRNPVVHLAPPIALGAAGLLVPVSLLLRRGSFVGGLGALVLAGMVTNALVVGLTAEAYGRYAARLSWLPLLVLLAAAANWLHRRRHAKSLSDPH